MTRSRGMAWALGLAALALLAVVVLLVVENAAMSPDAGWREETRLGAQCDASASSRLVREPFVRQEDHGTPGCVRWSASFVARSKMRAHLEMTLEGTATVSIDGRPVLADEGAQVAHATTAFSELAPGVHSFVVAFRGSGGPAYLRLGMEDALDPHDDDVVPPLDDDAFYPGDSEAARALAASPHPHPHPPWQPFLAALALVGAGTLGWLAIRAWRGRVVPRADLALAAVIFAAALGVRAHALDLQDRSWDELSYVNPGLHYVRNVILGDYFPEAWRFTFVHPPNTKWVLGIGALLGGLDGARLFGSVLSSLAATFLFGFGRVAFGRRVGVAAGALAVVLPLWVAHGRIAGHESMVLFWWCGSMLACACWLVSQDEAAAGARGAPDALAAFACGFAATAGVFSRATAVWIFPVLLLVWLANSRGTVRDRLRAFPVGAAAGAVAAGALAFAMFPFMWSGPGEKVARIAKAWGHPWGDIEVYLGKLCLPAPSYFVVAFLAETPAVVLVAGAAGALLVSRRSPRRRWGIVCIAWLAAPFGQSISTLRIGAARYVIPAWPALLLLAAVALVALGDALAPLLFQLSKNARAIVSVAPAAFAVILTGAALARVEPYPLDYFNELVGGPEGVAARKMFEVPWWGEGNRAAVRTLNQIAEKGARVRLALWPKHSIERLRDDLVPVDDVAAADYVLVSHLQYFERAPVGCASIGRVAVAGAPLVDTYRCSPASPVQLGFAAMTRNAPDQAVPYFRMALDRDPNDPAGIFGLGWVAQAKGDLRQAEALYLRAAPRAAQTGDLETEYYARYDLGTLYAQESKNEQAIEAFRSTRALLDRAPERLGDNAWSVWLNLGRALAAAGHEPEARETLARASALRPSDPATLDALRLLASIQGDGGTADAARDAR